MGNQPVLSVIIAVYNAEKTIARCLDSIFRQRDSLTRPDDVEVIAVDDASPDGSGEIMAKYRKGHPSLTIVSHSENKREANTRNTGIDHCNGEYFTFLDADDEYAPGALESILGAIEDKHPDLIHYCYSRVSADGEFVSRTRFHNPGFHLTAAEDAPTLRAVFQDTDFGLMTSGGVYRREVAQDLNFSSDFPISPDRHFGWEFFRKCTNVFQIDEPLYIYYQYEDSVSRQLTDEAVKGLLRLDRIFWEEFHQHPAFPSAAQYGFRRLFPGVVGWHLDIVSGTDPAKRFLRPLYFDILNSYLGRTANDELGKLGLAWLKAAQLLRSPRMIRLFRSWTFGIWRPMKSCLNRPK